MWWEAYDALDLYGGRITFRLDDSRDMFAVRFADGMTVDVGMDENGIYHVTGVSSDDVEGWNAPLCELEITEKDRLADAVGDVIAKLRPKRDIVDKNALVSEMLYILFSQCKESGAKYRYSEIQKPLLLCDKLVKLLYKDSFDERDRAVLGEGFSEFSLYMPCAFMRYNTDDLVFEPFLTPEPANRMLVLTHAVLRFGNKALLRNDAALMLHALHDLSRAYMTKRAEYLTESNAAVHPEEALSRSDAYIRQLRTDIDFERIIYSFSDVSEVRADGIALADGSFISFEECAENRRVLYPDSVSVAECNITAEPPYLDFFTDFMPTRVIFDKKGFSAKKHNPEDLHALCENISGAGYRTYDLS